MIWCCRARYESGWGYPTLKGHPDAIYGDSGTRVEFDVQIIKQKENGYGSALIEGIENCKTNNFDVD